MGDTVSSWILLDLSGHVVLYFGGATVVECFQPIRRPIGLSLQVGFMSIFDLGQTEGSKYSSVHEIE